MFDETIVGSFGYHFWFISTILQLYLVFPLIIKLKRKATTTFFIALVFLVSITYWVCTSLAGLTDQRVFNSLFLQYLWEFSLGIILSDMFKDNEFKFWDMNITLSVILSIVGVGITGLLAIKGGRVGKSFNDIFSLGGFFSLSVLCYWFLNKYFKCGKNAFLFIGRVSYELYLIHMVVLILIANVVFETVSVTNNIILTLACILPTAILLAILYHLAMQKLIFSRNQMSVK